MSIAVRMFNDVHLPNFWMLGIDPYPHPFLAQLALQVLEDSTAAELRRACPVRMCMQYMQRMGMVPLP